MPLRTRLRAPFSPDYWANLGRASFGVEMTSANKIYGAWDATDDTMEQYSGHWGWYRATADQGDVAQGDPVTTERCEIDTLGDIEPEVQTHPRLNLRYDFWIPTNHYTPGGSCAIVIGQVILTTYGPPVQIIYHTAGNLRARTLISGTFQHTVIANAGTFRGRWVHIDIEGVWSKTSAAETVIKVDGVTKYSLLGVNNVGPEAGDTNKVYAKVGAYRTAADTDPSRGLADVFYRSLRFDAN